jgi:hypothetical protein
MSIKTGTKVLEAPKLSRVQIRAEGQVSLFTVDAETGEPVELVASAPDGHINFRTGEEDAQVLVKVPEGHHYSYDVWYESPYDKADPIPVEVAEEQQETLEDKMYKFLGQMMLERYGSDSDEVDTFEEAMDFDIDGDGEIGSSLTQYEEMEEEEPIPFQTSNDPAAEPDPVAAGSSDPEVEPSPASPDGTSPPASS